MNIHALNQHLQTGATTVARAWAITRRDGVQFGFTDCDRSFTFEGITFEAEAGMTARAIQQTSGLSVDNSEAMGVLTDDRITETDINAGLYDNAVVQAWLVNWMQPEGRKVIFKGTLGEIRRQGHSFDAELRGLTEALNQPQGRVFQKPCTAVLGGAGCQFDMAKEGYFADTSISHIEGRDTFYFKGLGKFDDGWFTRGRIKILSGKGKSLIGWIKSDKKNNAERILTLWEPLRADIRAGDRALLHAGCDKRHQTCKDKFNNICNFQGFPFIPGDDWLAAFPNQGGNNDGKALG